MSTKFCVVVFLLGVASGFAERGAEVVSHIRRTHIESSAMRSVGYSRHHHLLEIEFVNGAIYRYYDVDLSVYRELINARSKARYYDFNIRRKYLSARVKPRTLEQSQN
jgi:hypothetical protein